MTGSRNFAWVTHAPADYMLVFTEDPDGEHAVVGARFEDDEQARDAGRSLEGAELGDRELHVYCTLAGEADRVLTGVRKAAAQESWVDSGRSPSSSSARGRGRAKRRRVAAET